MPRRPQPRPEHHDPHDPIEWESGGHDADDYDDRQKQWEDFNAWIDPDD